MTLSWQTTVWTCLNRPWTRWPQNSSEFFTEVQRLDDLLLVNLVPRRLWCPGLFDSGEKGWRKHTSWTMLFMKMLKELSFHIHGIRRFLRWNSQAVYKTNFLHNSDGISVLGRVCTCSMLYKISVWCPCYGTSLYQVFTLSYDWINSSNSSDLVKQDHREVATLSDPTIRLQYQMLLSFEFLPIPWQFKWSEFK